MEKIYSIFELLKIIEQRPWMYLLWKKSLNSLLDYLYWYINWVWTCWWSDKLLLEEFHNFQEYIVDNTIWKENRTNDCYLYWDCILNISNWDDEKWFNLFFELLDRYLSDYKVLIEI